MGNHTFVPFDKKNHTYRILDADSGLMFPATVEDGTLGYHRHLEPLLLIEQRAPRATQKIKSLLRRHPDWLHAKWPGVLKGQNLAFALMDKAVFKKSDQEIVALLPAAVLDKADCQNVFDAAVSHARQDVSDWVYDYMSVKSRYPAAFVEQLHTFVPFDKKHHTYRILDADSGLMFPVAAQDGVPGYHRHLEPLLLIEQRVPRAAQKIKSLLRRHPDWLQAKRPGVLKGQNLAFALMDPTVFKKSDPEIAALLPATVLDKADCLNVFAAAVGHGRLGVADWAYENMAAKSRCQVTSADLLHLIWLSADSFSSAFYRMQKTSGLSPARVPPGAAEEKTMSKFFPAMAQRWIARLEATDTLCFNESVSISVTRQDTQVDLGPVNLAALACLSLPPIHDHAKIVWMDHWYQAACRASVDFRQPLPAPIADYANATILADLFIKELGADNAAALSERMLCERISDTHARSAPRARL